MRVIHLGAAIAAVVVAAGPAGQRAMAQPLPSASARIDDKGTLQVPAFAAPYSNLASEEGRAVLIDAVRNPFTPPAGNPDPNAARKAMDDAHFNALVAKQLSRYRVKIVQSRIGGVPVYDVTPAAGVPAANARKVLILVHGGGFRVGARTLSKAESIPIAAVARMRVVAVDYRQAPEFRYPAANQDLTAVYKALLTRYAPASVGIYGCSAGGMITVETVAELIRARAPLPGAIGVLCASAGDVRDGDSGYMAPVLTGYPAPGVIRPPDAGFANAYFEGANVHDPLIQPIRDPSLLSRFPPTLLVTGMRSFEMSSVLQTHNALVRLGVDAELHVWEGMSHAFYANSDLPEAREASDVIARFFLRRLR